MKRRQVVRQGRHRPTKPPLEPTNLRDAVLDHARLEAQTYLTVAELRVFGRFPSDGATRKWLQRHPEVPRLARGREGRQLLINRRDFENALQPREDGSVGRHG